MTAKIYYTSTNKSFRMMKSYLQQNDVYYTTQHLKTESLTWEQLLEILMHTENGIEDLLSERTNEYLYLIEQGIDFDELTLTQFHELVAKYPTIVKSPILVAKGNTLIGYSEDEMSILKGRKARKREYNQVLSILQMNDFNNIENELYAY